MESSIFSIRLNELLQQKKIKQVDLVHLAEEKGIKLDSVIDEGGAILPVNVKGVINKKLAGVGVAEKGHVDFEISTFAKGGHSSQPPKHTALGRLAKIICKLENNQFKDQYDEAVRGLYLYVQSASALSACKGK